MVNFLAQAIDVNVHEISFTIEMGVPDVFDDFAAGDGIGRAKKKEFEEGKFLGSEGNSVSGAGDGAAMTVEFEIGAAQFGFAAAEIAADESAHAGLQFGESERLDEVIVGACVKAFDALLDEAASGEHENGRLNFFLAKFAAEFDAGHAREAYVEKDGVVWIFGREAEAFFAGKGDVHGVSILTKRASHKARDFAFVFDEQDAHGGQELIIR